MEDKPVRVLLVEDNPGDARLLQFTLAEAGRDDFELEHVDRLSAGLERLASGGIELVLLDLSLPDSHGLDTFSAIQAQAPQVPVVVLSGLDDREVAVTAVRMGAQDYLVKGKVDADLLVRAIRYAGERHAAKQEIRRRTEQLEEARRELEERAEALQEANERLQELDRLKSSFLASMTHELRTPLNSIIGFSEVLIDGVVGPVSPDQSECLENILTSGEHLMALINDILDLSKIEAGRLTLEPTPFKVHDLLGNVESTIRPLLDKKSQVLRVEEEEEALPLLKADVFRIKQVLLNLLSNACKFTPKEGVITLSCRLADPKAMLFSVADTGIGIKTEDQDIIFEEFRQAHKERPDEGATGTGLGLTISRRLAGMHGGSLWVESEYGEGATFHCLLPVSGPPQTAGEQPDDESQSREERLAIVVERDRLMCNLLALHLRQAGYTPLPRYGESSVLTLARDARPDFIALDMAPFDGEGLRLLSGLKSHPKTKSIPVVAMSRQEGGLSGLAIGVADLLVKPLRRDDLRRLMRRLGQRSGQNEPIKVVLVDADPATAIAVREGMAAPHCTLFTAQEAEEALELVHREKPDVILVDPAVSDLAGLELIQRLRSDPETRDIPIIGLAPGEPAPEEQARLGQEVRALAARASVEAAALAAEIVRLRGMVSTAEDGEEHSDPT
jgi:signal transduction histidine kinase